MYATTQDTPLLRRSAAQYADGVSKPNGRGRPNPFIISKTLMTGTSGTTSKTGKTALLVYFGWLRQVWWLGAGQIEFLLFNRPTAGGRVGGHPETYLPAGIPWYPHSGISSVSKWNRTGSAASPSHSLRCRDGQRSQQSSSTGNRRLVRYNPAD